MKQLLQHSMQQGTGNTVPFFLQEETKENKNGYNKLQQKNTNDNKSSTLCIIFTLLWHSNDYGSAHPTEPASLSAGDIVSFIGAKRTSTSVLERKSVIFLKIIKNISSKGEKNYGKD